MTLKLSYAVTPENMTATSCECTRKLCLMSPSKRQTYSEYNPNLSSY